MRCFRSFFAVAMLIPLLLSAAPAMAQSGTITVLFNADTRPQVPIMQFNPYPHEGIFATCSGLGSESSVYLQISVDGIMSSQQQCDVTIELHGLEGHSVDISAQDLLGVGPVFHLLVYGLDPSPTPTPGAPTATPGAPFGCMPSTTEGNAPQNGYTWSLAYSGHHIAPYVENAHGGGLTLPYGPITATTNIVVEIRNFSSNTTVGPGWDGWIANDNNGVEINRAHLFLIQNNSPSNHAYYHFSPNGQETRIYHTSQPGTTTEGDFCVWSVSPAGPTPTSTPIPPTLTATVTGTPLPTPAGNCSLINAFFDDPGYILSGTGDFFQRPWRIETGELPVLVTAVFPGGFTASTLIHNRLWQELQVHTTSISWSSPTPFGLTLCAPPIVIPTITPTPNVFATATPTRTPTNTPTGTLMPSVTPTNTPTGTALPTPTIPPTCLTPENEDSGECVIINQQQTQIALQQTQIALSNPATPIIPTSAASAVPNISTAVAIVCERDPCATGAILGEAVSEIITELQENADAPDCLVAFADLPDTTGPFALDMAGVGPSFCAVIEMTTYYREWVRVISVFFTALLAYGYYKATARRLGDV